MKVVSRCKRFLTCMVMILISGEILAKDFGKMGHSFIIKEEGFLEMITRKLNNINIEEHKQKLVDIAKRRLREPVPVSGIKEAKENKAYIFDPTFTFDNDVRNLNGDLIFKAGTKVNPLDRDLNRKIFFIDARNENQIEWLKAALDKHEADKTKANILPCIILVGGKPLELSEKLGRNVYFDQHGELTTKFKIRFVPATVEQKETEKVLIINEIVPDKK